MSARPAYPCVPVLKAGQIAALASTAAEARGEAMRVGGSVGRSLPVLDAKGVTLTAELRGIHAVGPRRNPDGDPTPIEELVDYLSLSEAQKRLEIAYKVEWYLELALRERRWTKLADELEHTGDVGDILERMAAKDPTWAEQWHAQAIRELIEQEPAAAPSFVYMDDAKLQGPGWLLHFSDAAEDIVREGFTHGLTDWTQLGLTTHYSERAKAQPGYVFAFAPGDLPRYGWSRGRLKYGRAAVLFRAPESVRVWHNSDEEPQCICWGPDARSLHLVNMNGRTPCLVDDDGEEREFGNFTDLVAAVAR